MAQSIVLDSDAGRLADALAASLDGQLADPFAEDIVVVPSLGVGRWLQQRLARRDGVCARVGIEFPGRFIWRLLERAVPGLPGRSPFDPAVARWAILALLDELPDEPGFEMLRERVALAHPQRRLELSLEIARVFDRYLAYRRDWLERWARGGWVGSTAEPLVHERWQRWLWTRLLERLPGVSREHPFQTFGQLLEEAGRSGADGSAALRVRAGIERIRLFGVLSMAPEQFQFYAALGAVFDVRWFAPDPCRDFWLDVVSTSQAARIAAEAPDSAWLYADEPSILGDWGRAQRDFLVHLRQLEESHEIEVDEDFRDRELTAPRSDLAALQASVLLRSDQPWRELADAVPAVAKESASIELHATHGPTRQVEVLHDRLLALFEEIPGLRPEQVAVFCTDIATYGGRVNAVFSSAPQRLRIPFRVSGETRATDQLAVATLEVLALAAQPVGVEAVVALLGNRALALALGLEPALADELRAALVEAGIHGDQERQRRLSPESGEGGDDPGPRHGWVAGIERLLLGAAASDQLVMVAGMVPVRMFSVRASENLGRLLVLLEDIDRFGGFAARAPVAAWCELTQRWLESRFGGVPELREGWLALRDALIELGDSASAGAAPDIDLLSFRQGLADALAASAGSAEPSGAVTVAPLGSLRGVPYRVVCLLGMDDDAWPRRSSPGEYDLMIARPRFGDRISRFDDRGIFLDALLSAGERLLIIYRGREARDNSPQQPATVVRELIAYLTRQQGAAPVIREHPLQPFSPRSFGAGERDAHLAADGERTRPAVAPSFAHQWRAAAQVLARPRALRPAPQPLAHRALTPVAEDSAALELTELVDVLARPARLFLRDGVGVALPFESARAEDDPPIDIAPSRRDLEQALRALRGGEQRDAIAARLARHPDYPEASLGLARARAVADAAAELAAALDAVEAELDAGALPRERVRLQVMVAGVTVSGEVQLAAGRGLHLVESAFPYGVRTAADAWLQRLLLQCAIEQGSIATDRPVRTIIATDGELRSVAPPSDAGAELLRLLEHRHRVRREALALFPKTTWAYLEAGGTPEAVDLSAGADGGSDCADLPNRDRAMKAAYNALRGTPGGSLAECEEQWLEAVWRGSPPPLESIIAAGLPLYGPLHQRIELVGPGRKGGKK